MNIKNIVAAVILAGSLACAHSALAQEMTLAQCVATALAGHPSLTAAEGTAEARKAQVSQAAVSRRTKLNASGSYSRSDNGNWDTGVSLSQNVFDWGKSKASIQSAQLSHKAAQADYLDTRNTVIADVKAAYYGLNKTAREIAVLRDQVTNYQKRLDWAQSYYSAGTKAKIEVTKAETDLANAKLALIQSESSQEQYKAQLASAMGVPALQITAASDELDYKKWDIPLNEALELAAQKRPDLASQALLVDKARADVRSAALTNAPDLTASGGYSFGGRSAFDDDQWSVKLNLEFQIGDGGMTKAKTAQSRAELKTAQAKYDKLAQDIVLEVRKAWQSLNEASASITAAQIAEKQAKETLDLALGRYRAGVGDSLEISDAVDGYAQAQTKVIACLYQHQEARLNLEKATGKVSAQ